jgi:hypothetical protein
MTRHYPGLCQKIADWFRVHDENHPQKEYKAPSWVLLVAVSLLTWATIGVWPIVPTEGDDAAIAAGAALIREGGSPRHPLLYRYDVQPATYWVTAIISRGLWLPAIQALGVLTIVSTFALIVLSAQWSAQATRISFSVALLITLLCQEASTTAYFGNSTVPAAALGTLGLVLLQAGTTSRRLKNHHHSVKAGWDTKVVPLLLAGLCFGIATLFRWDVVLLGPGALWLLWTRSKSSPSYIVACLGSWFAILLVGAWGLEVSVADVIGEGKAHLEHFGQWKQSLICWASWWSLPLFALTIVGLRELVVQKQKNELFLFVFGFVPSAIVYGWNLTTPKYLLYTLPFVVRVACFGIRELLAGDPPRHRRFLLGGLTLVVLQYPFGPLSLASWLTGKNFTVAGTHDGPRRLDALWASPWMWQRMKKATSHADREAITLLSGILQNTPQLVILTDDWFSSSWINLQLLEWGYLPVEVYRHFDSIPIRKHHDVHVLRKGLQSSQRPEFIAHFEIDWLEREYPTAAWSNIWSRYKEGTPTILLISGRWNSLSVLQRWLSQLPGLPKAEVRPAVVGPGRPWVFLLKFRTTSSSP